MKKEHLYIIGTTLAAIIGACSTFPYIQSAGQSNLDNVELMNRAESLMTLDIDEALLSKFEYNIDSLTQSLIISAEQLSKETNCLRDAIYYEARSEGISGQTAVGQVVINRVASKHYPNTICKVVYQGSERKTGCQFSFTCDGSMNGIVTLKSWEHSYKVAQKLIIGNYTPIVSNKVTHYHTNEIEPYWSKKMIMTNKVDSHVFYKFAPVGYSFQQTTAAP